MRKVFSLLLALSLVFSSVPVKAGASGEFLGMPADVDKNGNLIINEKNFPDNLFRAKIAESCDFDSSGTLTEEEASELDTLGFQPEFCYVRDLQGIEFFPELEELNIAWLGIEKLDLSRNLKLRELDCTDNFISELILPESDALEILQCSKNYLTALDLSRYSKLKEICCSNNYINNLVLPKRADITDLDCSGNELETLDVSSFENLEILYCDGNKLKSLSLTNNRALYKVDCGENLLETLVLPKNANIFSFDCGGNKLETTDFSRCGEIEYLDCSSNEYRSLDVSALENVSLNCFGNKLETLILPEGKSTIDYCTEILPGKIPGQAKDGVLAEFNGSPAYVDEGGNLLLNKENFPNPGFLRELIFNFDKEFNGFLTEEQVSDIDYMEYACLVPEGSRGGCSLKGIEYFTSLKELVCGTSCLNELDLSQLEELEWLNASPMLTCCSLKSLVLPESGKLKYLMCDARNIENLSVHSELEEVSCYKIAAEKLSFAGNESLQKLSVCSGRITKLDLGACPNLAHLDCSRNRIKVLDLRECPALEELACWDNPGLIRLLLNENIKLAKYRTENTLLPALDLDAKTAQF